MILGRLPPRPVGFLPGAEAPAPRRRSMAIAHWLGWSKTYDAEYLALARLLRVPIATFEQRVKRAAERLGIPIHKFD